VRSEVITGPLPGLEFVQIPGGSFRMGSLPDEEGHNENEGPQHRVTIKPFHMMTTPVSQAQWQRVIGLNPSSIQRDELPVENVSLKDILRFIKALSELQFSRESKGWHAELVSGFRLPSEAEWEFACRAGTTTRYSGGDEYKDLDNAGWHRINSGGTTHPSSVKKPNPWGLYDMHGNVWELCEDHYHNDYRNAPDDGLAWLSVDSSNRVVRGGSWFSSPDNCRSASRRMVNVDIPLDDCGFRLVCSL